MLIIIIFIFIFYKFWLYYTIIFNWISSSEMIESCFWWNNVITNIYVFEF